MSLILQSSGVNYAPGEDVLNLVGLTLPMQQRRPVSFSQERMWLALEDHQFPARANICIAVLLDGAISRTRFVDAVRAVVRREQALQSNFTKIQHEIIAFARIERSLRVECRGVEGNSTLGLLRNVRSVCREHLAQAFDLSKDMLVRMTLVSSEQLREYAAVFSFHHIIFDGRSWIPFMTKVAETYANEGDSKEDRPGEPGYYDFAVAQRNSKGTPGWRKDVAFWRAKLENVEQARLKDEKPVTDDYAIESTVTGLSTGGKASLLQLAARIGCPPDIVILSAYVKALGEEASSRDLTITNVFSKRNHLQQLGMVGLFTERVFFRFVDPATMGLAQLCSLAKSQTADALTHSDLPMGIITEEILGADKGKVLSPAEIRFSYFESQRRMRLGRCGDLRLLGVPTSKPSFRGRIWLSCHKQASRIRLSLWYNVASIRREKAQHILTRIDNIITESAS